jgi:hypothetical protein
MHIESEGLSTYWTNCAFGLYPLSGVSKNKQNNKIEELKIYTKYHKLLTTEQLTWAHTHMNPWSKSDTGGSDVCTVIFWLYFQFLDFVCSWDTRRWITHHRQNHTEIVYRRPDRSTPLHIIAIHFSKSNFSDVVSNSPKSVKLHVQTLAISFLPSD